MKIVDWFRRKPKATEEKQWYYTDEGLLNSNWDLGWWQQNLQPGEIPVNETVEACVSALSQTVAMCPVEHLVLQDDGEHSRRIGSNPERVLLNPNAYTTRSLFFNELIRAVYLHGNGYAVAERDGNRAVSELHLVDPRHMNGIKDPESGEVFYWASPHFGNKFDPDQDRVYMARDVLNVRINTRRDDPLKGVTPITHAASSIAAHSAITGHQAKFFNQMSRPSGVLTTDQMLNREQMKQLRQAYEEQSKGINSGKLPILSAGLKFDQMSLSSQDAQLVEAFGMTVESISRAFRVPLPLVNSLSGSTYSNAESMMNWFLSSGLGFLLEHIELELNKLFDLPFRQRLNFNTKALLRSDWKTQIETLGEGVLKGIYSPNEARAMLGYGAVKDGDEPRVQQQVVPLSAWDETTAMAEPAPEPEPEPDVQAAFTKGWESARKAY